MRNTFLAITAVALALHLCGIANAAADDGQGVFKISLDSLPFFSDREEEAEDTSREYEEPTEYTYDATGRKVPVRTERSGTASPLN